MANFSITVSNSLNVLGGGEPSLWNTMAWGDDNWGNTKDVRLQIEKCLSEAASIASAVQSILTKIISNSFAFSDTSSPTALQSGVWDYILDGGVTDPSSRPTTTYTEDSDAGTSYSDVGADDTDWDDA